MRIIFVLMMMISSAYAVYCPGERVIMSTGIHACQITDQNISAALIVGWSVLGVVTTVFVGLLAYLCIRRYRAHRRSIQQAAAAPVVRAYDEPLGQFIV
jgi:hypothetical protein